MKTVAYGSLEASWREKRANFVGIKFSTQNHKFHEKNEIYLHLRPEASEPIRDLAW